MAVVWNLTNTEEITPEPEYRPATEVTVDSYFLEEFAVGSAGANVLVKGLENGVTAKSAVFEPLDAAHYQRLFATPVLAADYANDLTADQTASSGTTSTVIKSGAGWTDSEFVGKVIVFTGGTNGNADGSVRALVSANTTDEITFAFYPAGEFVNPCDNTTTFKVLANALTLLRREAMRQAMAQLGKAGTLG